MSALDLTLGWVADGGRAARCSRAIRERAVGDVVTDSRSLRAGDLFVALRGPRFDGHAFVGEVLGARRGGRDRRAWRAAASGTARAIIEVRRHARRRCRTWRTRCGRRSRRKVVAITGSAGKTTTKETIAEFLATRFAW